MNESSPVTVLHGVGPKRAEQLARLGMAVKRGGASLRDRMGREQEAVPRQAVRSDPISETVK